MKKLFRLNNNICDQILNEAQIHFTKNCSNRCPFCIDAFNNGVGNKKPDIDNIAKSILDAMNGFVFKDDNQVAKISIEKRFATEEKAEIIVEEY